MRSLSSQSRPVHRIVFGTATLLGIGSLLALAASQQSSRAIADRGDLGVSYPAWLQDYVCYEADVAGGDEQETTPGILAPNLILEEDESIAVIRCCAGAGGCAILNGSSCPSGTSQTSCPCNPAA